MLANYDFITGETLAYFTPRLTQAPQDADFALDYVKAECRDAGRAGSGPRRAALQMRRALDPARRALPRLCRARHDPAGRLRAEVIHGKSRRRREQRPQPRAAHCLPFRRHAQPLDHHGAGAADAAGRAGGRDPAARRRCGRRRRDHRFARPALHAGAARADRQGCRRHAAGPCRQGMPGRCRPASTRRSRCWPS